MNDTQAKLGEHGSVVACREYTQVLPLLEGLNLLQRLVLCQRADSVS